MRLIDANLLLAQLEDDKPLNWTDSEEEIQEQVDWERFRGMVVNAPTVEEDIIVDGFTSTCPSGGHHDYRMVAIGSDEVGDRVNTYRCSKCGEEFNVKFVT
jgi:hypothetical protein